MSTTAPQFAGPPLIAGASIPPNVFIMLSPSAANTALQATANANVIGASGSATATAEGFPGYDANIAFATGEPVGADFLGSVTLVKAGGAVTLASPYLGRVEANSSGFAVNSSSAGNHNFAGYALDEAAAAGELIRVWLAPKSVTI